MNSIDEEFKHLSMVLGNTLILRPRDAMAFVRKCQERNVRVLGIDGFHLKGEAIQPDMGESIDLSQPPYRGQDCWKLAEKFLTQRLESSLHFEIVAEQ